MPTRSGVRLLLGVLLVPFGVAIGAAAVLVHDTWWGLPLSIVAAAATAAALPGGSMRVGFSFGWAAAVVAFAVPRPAGGYLVAGNLTGYAVLLTALVLAVTALATLPPRVTGPAGNDGSDRHFPTVAP